MNDIEFMKLALDEAQVSYLNRDVPVGAVLVIDGEIISKGHNTKVLNNNPLGHAECNCIIEACNKLGVNVLENASLYITCEPCLMCAGLIINTHISKIVYGTTEPKFGVCESMCNVFDRDTYKFPSKVEVVSGILQEECSKIMREFFHELRTK